MCGIAGIVDVDAGPIPAAALHAMIAVQRHRGPEGEAFHLEPGAALGHCRLSIIGLGPAGTQPMTNEDRTLWLVCNGEILNYRQLRLDLIARGHRFASETDVEVILHLYEEQGERCVDRLRGFFAFALWDSRRRRLVLGRDRIGQKPLLFGRYGTRIAFASEAKGVIASGCIPPDLDPRAIDLLRMYRSIPWPHTMFRHVHKLAPATVAVVERDGRMHERTYWVPPAPDAAASARQSIGRLRDVLRDAARAQSISDVPVGALLSGGLDSSLTAFLVREVVGDSLQTFTVAYAGTRDRDEDLAMARQVAAHLGTVHHEVIVDDSMIERLPDALWHWDEPYSNPTLLPHFELCRAMKPHVTVVHAGDGADELFGGYSGYAHWAWWHRLSPFPRAIGLGRAAWSSRWARLAAAAPDEVRDMKYAGLHRDVRAAYRGDLLDAVETGGPCWLLRDEHRRLSGSFMDRLLMTDLRLNNAHGTTTLGDAAGMASAVEIRSIFLDHQVVEHAARIPWSVKYRGYWQRKAVLRDVARPFLPPGVLSRRKVGYGEALPAGQLLRTAWRPVIEGVLFDGALDRLGWFDRQAVARLWGDHLAGHDRLDSLWMLMCIGLWYDRLLSQRPSQTAAPHLAVSRQ